MYSLSYNSQIKCFRTHVDMDIFSCLGMWKSCRKFARIFQLHPVCSVVFMTVKIHITDFGDIISRSLLFGYLRSFMSVEVVMVKICSCKTLVPSYRTTQNTILCILTEVSCIFLYFSVVKLGASPQ
jgi:hypothetical protein